MRTLFLFAVYLISFFWYFLVFLVILPWLVVNVGQALDYFLFDFFLKIRFSWPEIAAFWQGVGFFLAVSLMFLGTAIIWRATRFLREGGVTFPFSVVTHKDCLPRQLVVGGVYARVRHPVLLGYVLILAAFCLFAKTPLGLLVVLPLLAGLLLEILFWSEERHLLVWFGEEYQRYRARTPALLPKWR